MSRMNARARGAGLIEIIAGVSVGLGLMVGAVVMIQSTIRGHTVSELMNTSVLVQSRFAQLNNSNRNFPEGDVSLTFARENLPGIISHPDGKMSHKWASSVTVEAEGDDVLQIMFNGMSRKHCEMLLVNAASFPRVSGVYTKARINLDVYPLSIVDGASHCTRDDLDVGFVFSSTAPPPRRSDPDRGGNAPGYGGANGEDSSAAMASSDGEALRPPDDRQEATRTHSRGRTGTDGGSPSQADSPLPRKLLVPDFNFSRMATPSALRDSADWGSSITSNKLVTGPEFPVPAGSEVIVYGDGSPTFKTRDGSRSSSGMMPANGTDIVLKAPVCGDTATIVLEVIGGSRGIWTMTRPEWTAERGSRPPGC